MGRVSERVHLSQPPSHLQADFPVFPTPISHTSRAEGPAHRTLHTAAPSQNPTLSPKCSLPD